MSEQENSIVSVEEMLLQQYMGGEQDQSAHIAILPERVDFDKRIGLWSAESLGDGLVEMGGRLVAAVTIWAVWTDKVGEPLCLDIGKPCDNPGHTMGLRIIFADDNDDLFMWDAFGISFKSAQSAIRRSKNRNGRFLFDGRKQIGTRNGQFYKPMLEVIDEIGASDE